MEISRDFAGAMQPRKEFWPVCNDTLTRTAIQFIERSVALKISSSARKSKKLRAWVGNDKGSSPDADRSMRISKASAYLDATRMQFALNVAAASARLVGTERGALAGPIARSLPHGED